MEGRTRRINVTLSDDLLKQLDAIAARHYMARSTAIRNALIHWIESDQKRSNIAAAALGRATSDDLARILTDKQQAIFKEYRRGQATYTDLMEVGITQEQILQLMELGEF